MSKQGKSMKIVFTLLLLVLLSIYHTPLTIAQTSELQKESSPSASVNAIAPNPQEIPPAGINLSVSPIFLSLVTDPGSTVSAQIKVINNSNFREYLRLGLNKLEVKANAERPVPVELDPNDEFKNWISFSNPEFILDANETKTIRVTLAAPSHAFLGYYYAILISRITERPIDSVGAVVSGSPAIPLILEVRSPSAKKELQLLEFKTSQFIYEYPPTEFQIKIENTGNIHIAPFGDIFIDSPSEKEMALVHANATRSNILPGQIRTLTAEWDDSFASRKQKQVDGKLVTNKEGKPEFETVWDFSKADRFRIGKYTANLVLVYDNGQRDIPIEATVSFWILPWKIILGASIIVLLTLFALKVILSGLIRRIYHAFQRN